MDLAHTDILLNSCRGDRIIDQLIIRLLCPTGQWICRIILEIERQIEYTNDMPIQVLAVDVMARGWGAAGQTQLIRHKGPGKLAEGPGKLAGTTT